MSHRSASNRFNSSARNFPVLAFTFAAAPLFAWLAQAEDYYDAVGGKGDRSEQVRCPSGEYLIGFYGRTGLWIDQIGLTCGRFVKPSYNLRSMERLSPRGGPGGGPNAQDCGLNGAIRSMDFFVISDVSEAVDKYVSAIRFHCLHPVDGSPAGDPTYGGTYTHGRRDVFGELTMVIGPHPEGCDGDEYATGLTVRYGKHVNAVGLICDHFKAQGTR